MINPVFCALSNLSKIFIEICQLVGEYSVPTEQTNKQDWYEQNDDKWYAYSQSDQPNDAIGNSKNESSYSTANDIKYREE